MRLCDVTMFWSESGGGVRRYLEEKRNWLVRARPEHQHLLVIPGRRRETLQDSSGRMTSVIRASSIPFAPGYRIPLRGGAVVGALADWSPAFVECGSPFTMRRAVSRYRRLSGTPVFDYYHAYFPLNYTAALFGRRRGLKRLFDRIGWAWLRTAYADSTRVFVASPVVRDSLARHGISNTELAPLGVDLEIFRQKADGEASRKPSILFAGRLTEEKGLSAVLECYSILRKKSALTLTVVGNGLLRPRVEAMAARDSGIIVRGFLPQQELAAAYREAWVLVSGAPAETLGLCFLESLASGTPVVGLSGSGLMDGFPNEVARAVRGERGERLAEGVSELLASPPGAGSCRSVAEDYGWDRRLSCILAREIELSKTEGGVAR
jgi:alpha-1,6-mannosyltransferase